MQIIDTNRARGRMKFKKLLLEDFQTHQSLTLEFSSRITTIKGPTDVGKSAVLRALRWLSLNNFPGDSFIRDGAKSVLVRLTTNEGDVIDREKGRENLYALGKKEFKAVGTGKVPDEVERVLQVSALNFQGQYDSPFWFTESAPEVSRQMNAVIDLSIIDTTLSNIVSTVRKATERRSLCEERIAQFTGQLKDMEEQEDRVADYKDLKKLKDEADHQTERYNQLDELLSNIDWLNIPNLQTQAEDAERLVVLAKLSMEQQERQDKLEELIEDIDVATHELSVAETKMREAEETFHQKTKGQKCPICGNTL